MAGDVIGAAYSAGVHAAEDQYATAKTSVWWDLECCHVPETCDPHLIAFNISSSLAKLNYCAPVSISAYGDTYRIPHSLQHALSGTGISLNHVPSGSKDGRDMRILVDMIFWAVDNSVPANYLLISDDRVFSNCLHQLSLRRYNVLLALPYKEPSLLAAAAKTVWLWSSLSNGGDPLNSQELKQLEIGARPFKAVKPKSRYSESAQSRHPVSYDFQCVSKWIQAPKTSNKPAIVRATTTSTLPVPETMKDDNSYKPEDTQETKIKIAPHEFFQVSTGPINIILRALDFLRDQKLLPTEVNICDCIRFGEPKYRGIDVSNELKSAVEQNMVEKDKVGANEVYVRKDQQLWRCANSFGGDPNQLSQQKWDRVEKFLTSSAGQPAMLASSCRYEAALILKKACLEEFALGEILQILNMIVFIKRWIKAKGQPGWQPITITLKGEMQSNQGA